MAKGEFIADMQQIKARAREHMEKGAVTSTYNGNSQAAVKVLNEALATELVCVMRYKRHHFMAKGINSEPIAEEFLLHSREEMEHAELIAKRIVQLGGAPDFNPATLTGRSHADYVEGDSLADMVKENLVAERIAIDTYREMVKYFGNDDPTTRRMIESILAVEEEHADDMSTLLEKVGPASCNGSKN
jgi:bacterioferritin